MSKKDWEKSQSDFRKILYRWKKNINNNIAMHDGLTEGKFGIVFIERTGGWHIWNGRRRNTVCTLRFLDGKVLVRYRRNSFYKYQIFKFDMPESEMIFVPSTSLGRFRDNVCYRIQSLIDGVNEVQDIYRSPEPDDRLRTRDSIATFTYEHPIFVDADQVQRYQELINNNFGTTRFAWDEEGVDG
jgi:hypothetical protein